MARQKPTRIERTFDTDPDLTREISIQITLRLEPDASADEAYQVFLEALPGVKRDLKAMV